MNTKIRLTLMNFLQYAVWGAWLISLGAYLGNTLKFDGLQIGSFFATMGIASLFMPAVMGIIADRWIPAQRLLGLCHLFAAGFITLAATRTDYNSLYTLVLLSVMFYMPTIALSNSVAYNALEKAGLDTVTHFPPIRVWGTVGFICAMWVVDLGKMGLSATQLYFSATLGLILGLYSFTLPNCPINRSGGGKSIVDLLGLRAFALFKQRKMAIFFIFSMLLGMSLQITNAFADGYIKSFGDTGIHGAKYLGHLRRRTLHDPDLALADLGNALHSAYPILSQTVRHQARHADRHVRMGIAFCIAWRRQPRPGRLDVHSLDDRLRRGVRFLQYLRFAIRRKGEPRRQAVRAHNA